MTSDKSTEVSISIDSSLHIDSLKIDSLETDDALENTEKSPGALDQSRIERLVRLILDSENIEWKYIGVIFSTHEFIRNLNRTYLGHDYDTDVLSFVIEESDQGMEGEVYIDVEMALERHDEFKSTLRGELERYVVHGVLHLAGHEDGSENDKNQMHALENHYLAQL